MGEVAQAAAQRPIEVHPPAHLQQRVLRQLRTGDLHRGRSEGRAATGLPVVLLVRTVRCSGGEGLRGHREEGLQQRQLPLRRGGLLWWSCLLAGPLLLAQGGQTGDTTVEEISRQRQIQAQVDRLRLWAGFDGGWLIGGLTTLQHRLENLLLLLQLPALLLAGLLGRQTHHLLDRQQGAGALDQALKATLKGLAALRWQLVVALRDHLGGQMKTGLLHAVQQAIAQDLEVQGQIAVEGRGELLLLLKQREELRLGLVEGSNVGVHQQCAERGAPDQAACMAATSAAKSIFSISMPSPRLKRTKRRTWMFSPILPETSLTSWSTVMPLSLM